MTHKAPNRGRALSQVGDIVEVRRGEVFPADIAFLRAFNRDDEAPEVCYVQTAQLDGETNLKMKQALPETVDAFSTPAKLGQFRGCITAEPPNGIFSKFTATIQIRPGETPMPLAADQVR